MSKGQRGNKEAKKPKKALPPPAVPGSNTPQPAAAPAPARKR